MNHLFSPGAFLRLLLFLVIADTLSAQIDVAPVHVLLNSRQRDTEIFVTNSLDETVEVTTRIGFKVLRSDSLGNRRLDTAASAAELSNSCESWIKLYPQKVLLPPRGTRSLRVMILPPESIPDGEYWARLEIMGQRVGRPGQVNTDTAIVMEIRTRLNVGIPVTFRKGKVETGIAIDDISAQRIDSGFTLLVDTRRLGNAAYRGTLRATVRGVDGKEILVREREFTNETKLRNSFNLTEIPEGTYDLEIESRSIRTGNNADAVLSAPLVMKSYRLSVSPSDVSVASRE